MRGARRVVQGRAAGGARRAPVLYHSWCILLAGRQGGRGARAGGGGSQRGSRPPQGGADAERGATPYESDPLPPSYCRGWFRVLLLDHCRDDSC